MKSFKLTCLVKWLVHKLKVNLVLLSLLTLFLTILLCLSACETKKQATLHFAKEETFGTTTTLKVAILKTEISTNETIKVSLTYSAPEDIRIVPPKPNFKGLIIGDKTEKKPSLQNGIVTIQQQYELYPTLAGTYTIPALSVSFFNREKESKVTSTPIKIKVNSLLSANDKDIADIFDSYTKENHSQTIFFLSGLGILSLLIFSYIFYRHKRHQPQLSAQELALKKLNILKEEKLKNTLKVKDFYSELSLILREFIEQELHLKASEKTTAEFLPEMQQSAAFSHEQQKLLAEFLQQADLVKFAKHQPNVEHAEFAFKLCYDFIQTQKYETNNTKQNVLKDTHTH